MRERVEVLVQAAMILELEYLHPYFLGMQIQIRTEKKKKLKMILWQMDITGLAAFILLQALLASKQLIYRPQDFMVTIPQKQYLTVLRIGLDFPWA